MVQFKVFFEHGPIMVVEAESGEQARRVAGTLARENGTFVKKVKLVKQLDPIQQFADKNGLDRATAKFRTFVNRYS